MNNDLVDTLPLNSVRCPVLVSITRPTRILWVIPQLFGLSAISPIFAAIIAGILDQPALFWGLCALISSYGAGLYITFKEGDFIRVKRAQHRFKRTRNYRPEGVQKYVS